MTGQSASAVLAVDLGGTTIKGALVDRSGRMLATYATATAAPEQLDAMAGLLAMLDRLATQAAAQDVRPAAAGIVVPGIVGPDGRVAFASNLGWRDHDIRGPVARHLGLPVAVGHDVRAAGQAEAMLGAARSQRHFAMVTIGTGIAAALMSDGRLISGAGYAAGEIGHIPVIADGEACACGQFGCMEAYASAASIARRYRALGGSDALTAAEVAAASGTDPTARRVWADAVRALSLGLATLTLLLDPALIVLGGGLSRAGPRLIDPLRIALTARLAWRPPPELALSALGEAAGRIGAAILAAQSAGWGDAVGRWSEPAADDP